MTEIKRKFRLPWEDLLNQRVQETTPLIQILIGPRQVGKTTSLLRLREHYPNTVYGSADEKQLEGSLWIERLWNAALSKPNSNRLLILDEIQKIDQWSETIKRLWDETLRNSIPLKLILSGSSALSIQTGLSESLAGRFEIIPATHLGWPEFQRLTGASIEHFLFFGGYPRALEFISDEQRWRNYINQSIVESVLSKDILLMTRIDKPALFRRLFQLGCEYSGQILSFQKSMGLLSGAGNTTTLAHYLELLEKAFLLSGLQKFEKRRFRLRNSSPKYQIHNTALMGALGSHTFSEAHSDSALWGRYLESAIGAFLINQSRIHQFQVFYWKNGQHEVDFVVKSGTKVAGIEVKSTTPKRISGLKEFRRHFPKAKPHVLGHHSDELSSFFSNNPCEFLF